MSSAEKLRPIAVATCMEVIGHDEGTIIAAATKCISKLKTSHFDRVMVKLSVQNFTKEKAIKELTPYLAQSTMQFVRTLWRNVENASNLDEIKQVPGGANWTLFSDWSHLF